MTKYVVLMWPRAEIRRLRRGSRLQVDGTSFSTLGAAQAAAEVEAETAEHDAQAAYVVVARLCDDVVDDWWRYSPSRRTNPPASCVTKEAARKAIAPVAKALGCSVDEVARAATRKAKSSRSSAPATPREKPTAPAPLAGVAVDTEARLIEGAGTRLASAKPSERIALAEQIAARRVERPAEYVVALVDAEGGIAFDSAKNADRLASAQPPGEWSSPIVMPPLLSGDAEFDARHAKHLQELAAQACGPLVAAERRRVLAACRRFMKQSPPKKKARRSKRAAVPELASSLVDSPFVDPETWEAEYNEGLVPDGCTRQHLEESRSQAIAIVRAIVRELEQWGKFDVGTAVGEVVHNEDRDWYLSECGTLEFEIVAKMLDSSAFSIHDVVATVRFEAGVYGWDQDNERYLIEPEMSVWLYERGPSADRELGHLEVEFPGVFGSAAADAWASEMRLQLLRLMRDSRPQANCTAVATKPTRGTRRPKPKATQAKVGALDDATKAEIRAALLDTDLEAEAAELRKLLAQE
jgi:hypothetical protein